MAEGMSHFSESIKNNRSKNEKENQVYVNQKGYTMKILIINFFEKKGFD